MERKTEILPFFTNPDFQQSQTLLNYIIEKAYRIAVKYLHYHQKKIINLLSREEITIQELAIDCICDLFIKDSGEDDLVILKAFNKWEPKIETEEDAIYFLNKIVANRVEQHLFKLLKSNDPFFAKLLDAINYLVKQNGYKKIQFLGKTYLTENALNDFSKDFITSEAFDRLPLELFAQKKFLLKNILNYLKLETNFNPAIPLNDLVIRLKQINFADYLAADSEDVLSKKIEVKEFIDIGLKAVNEKLNVSYFDKNKLTKEEISAIESAMQEIAVDLSNGGISPGLYNYLSPHLKGLSEIEYKEKYHNILDYLIRVMKNTIAKELLGKK